MPSTPPPNRGEQHCAQRMYPEADPSAASTRGSDNCTHTEYPIPLFCWGHVRILTSDFVEPQQELHHPIFIETHVESARTSG